jgi:hypothetical protein
MPYVNPDILDDGLEAIIARCTGIYVCSAYPTTYAEASTTAASDGFALGGKVDPTISGPSDRSGGGRKVLVAAFEDGTVLDEGDAAYYALVDSDTSERLIAGPLRTVIEIVDEFKLVEALEIGFPNYEDGA